MQRDSTDFGRRQAFIAPPPRSPWTVAVQLCRGGGSFRGFLEFAIIGAIVLWFVQGGTSVRSIGSLLQSSPSAESPPIAAQPQAWQRLPAPRLSDISLKPSDFDPVPQPLRDRLIASLSAYEKRDSAGAASALSEADENNSFVVFMRGLVQLSIPGAESVTAGLRSLERAVDLGNARAMTALGVMKIIGIPGLPRDPEGGQVLLERAITAGDAVAMRIMGEGYVSGWVGVVDPARSEKYLRLAADRGDLPAMQRLGEMYQLGQGVPRNEAAAEKLFKAAAIAGYAEAQAMMGVIRLKPYSARVTDNPDEALDWFERAAAQGNPHAMYYLAIFYMELGARINRLNPERSIEYLRRCALETAYFECAGAYGAALDNGIGVKRDPVTAYAMYTIAAVHPRAKSAKPNRDKLEKSLSEQEKLKAQVIVNATLRDAVRPVPSLVPTIPDKPLKPSADLPRFQRVERAKPTP